jgi:hypothetical protein
MIGDEMLYVNGGEVKNFLASFWPSALAAMVRAFGVSLGEYSKYIGDSHSFKR